MLICHFHQFHAHRSIDSATIRWITYHAMSNGAVVAPNDPGNQKIAFGPFGPEMYSIIDSGPCANMPLFHQFPQTPPPPPAKCAESRSRTNMVTPGCGFTAEFGVFQLSVPSRIFRPPARKNARSNSKGYGLSQARSHYALCAKIWATRASLTLEQIP